MGFQRLETEIKNFESDQQFLIRAQVLLVSAWFVELAWVVAQVVDFVVVGEEDSRRFRK